MLVKQDRLGHRHNYWYSQGAFRCKKCGHVTYKPENGKKKLVLIPIIIAVAIAGYFIYQIYGVPESTQSQANNVLNNASKTIQQVSSQVSQQSTSLLQNHTLSFTNQERMPITVFNDCSSFLRTDLKYIDTTCSEKHFQFAMPSSLVDGLGSEDIPNMKTTVYQYENNDFKIGLYDQVGEKNYTVSLWQLPQ